MGMSLCTLRGAMMGVAGATITATRLASLTRSESNITHSLSALYLRRPDRHSRTTSRARESPVVSLRSAVQMWHGWASVAVQMRHTGEPSRQMWQTGERNAGADVARVSPVPMQM